MSRRDWGSGSIDERSPGRWRVTVPLPSDPLTGKRRRRRFTVKGTISDARQALNEAIHERDHGGVDPNRITTGEWLMVWLDGRVRDGDLGLRAALGYRSILQNHLIPAIGHVLLQDLRPDHVRRMKDLLSESLAPATVRKTLVVLGTALKSAVALELLAKNPASAVRKPSSSQQEGERRALDKDEIKELLRVAAGTVLDMPIRFALATGARQSELLGAMWGAIDLEERTFRVMQALHYVDREFRLLRPKSQRSRRSILLSPKTVARLRDHRADQQAERLRLGTAWQDHDLVFPNARGEYWHRQAFYTRFRKLLAESTIADPKSVTFHSLRHTAASQWILAGVDPATVARRLGHSRTAFTLDVYTHMLPGQQEAAAEVFDDLIG